MSHCLLIVRKKENRKKNTELQGSYVYNAISENKRLADEKKVSSTMPIEYEYLIIVQGLRYI